MSIPGSLQERRLTAFVFGVHIRAARQQHLHCVYFSFSSRPRELARGADVRLVKGDVRPVHAEMKAAAAGQNLWLVGGGELVGQFYDAGLLDEIIVQIGSVTLGRGKQILPRRITNPALRLISVQKIGAGFAELRYEVARQTRDQEASPFLAPRI